MPRVGVGARATRGPTGCLDDWILTLGSGMRKVMRDKRWEAEP
jgi:hypothetical protein